MDQEAVVRDEQLWKQKKNQKAEGVTNERVKKEYIRKRTETCEGERAVKKKETQYTDQIRRAVASCS
jgi:hypothetical protein